MRPRRSVFAKDYLGETVDVYLSIAAEENPSNQALIKWGRDVLTKFFSVVGEDATIDPLRERFECRHSAASSDTLQLVPYRRDQTPLPVDYDGLAELAWRRRSVRWYLDKPVPRDIIDRAIEVAKLSPSACNRQPFEFRVFDDPAEVKKIGEIPMGTAGFSQNFPCMIVVVGDLRAYFSERDRHVIYVDGGLAAMALQFALEVQGVSSCCINFPDIESRERRMADALGLAPNERPIMCMSLGYPDPTGKVPYSQKKSLDEIRSYNKTC